MRVFVTKSFARFAHKERIDDASLCEAIARAGRGQIDADLGGGVIKQRVARAGGGRSGGYRTLIAFHAVTRSVFMFGFAKSERDNIGLAELAGLKKLAQRYMAMSDAEIAVALSERELEELSRGGEYKS